MSESSPELAIQGAFILPEIDQPTPSEHHELTPPLFTDEYANIIDKFRDRKLMNESPRNSDLFFIDFENYDNGTIISRLNHQAIVGRLSPDYPANNKFAAVFLTGSPKSPEVFARTIATVGQTLAHEKAKLKSNLPEKNGVVFGSIPKGAISEVEILKALSEAGLVEVKVLKGKTSDDPYRFEGRRKKEGEREGVEVEQILLAKPYYQEMLTRTERSIMQMNPDVTSVDKSLLMETKIKDFRTLNDRFSSGTGLVVTFKCGTQWKVGASRPMTHCADTGCVHEQQEPRVPRIENKKIDPTINEAKMNPGRNIKTEMKCYDCDQHLYRRVEAVKQADGTFKDYLYNICLADGQKGFRKPV